MMSTHEGDMDHHAVMNHRLALSKCRGHNNVKSGSTKHIDTHMFNSEYNT